VQLVRRLTTILLFFFSITWVACQEKKDRQGSQQSDIPESLSQKALLITADELAEGWKPLIDWKRKRGIYIELHTISEIKAAEKGPDTQEKIRQFVQKQITNNEITSLILGGDSLPGGRGLVPDRDTFHQNMWGESADIPTDLYYLSSTNWDADGDGVYGEYEDDQEAISYPDGSVGLGRIPVRTLVDIAAYTQKVIAYESRYPSEEFANNFLYSCTVPAAHPKLRKSWDDYISKKFPNGKIQWYSTDESPWDQEEKGDYDITSSHLVKLFNDSRMGKMHFHGHGIFPGWVMEDQQNLFTYQHVHQLKNLNAYPLITTVSCFTGQYDAEYDPCIAESMIRKENAGSTLQRGQTAFCESR